MKPSFLRSEILPYASIEIVRETPEAAFARWLASPQATAQLDAMLADNARVDAELAERHAAQLREDDRLDTAREGDGATCTVHCGYCGRCN